MRVRCFRRHHQGGAGRGGRAGGAELAGIIGVATYRYCTSTIRHFYAYKFLALHPSKEGDSLRSYSFFLEGDICLIGPSRRMEVRQGTVHQVCT